MAKDGTNRGGRRVRAGDKPKPLAEKIAAGENADIIEFTPSMLEGAELEDAAYLAGEDIPNLVYLAPTNCEEYFAMLEWSIEQNSYPVAIRMLCNGVHHADRPVDTDYSALNRYKVTQNGTETAILALGDFYQLGEELAALIAEKTGNVPTLINPRYITGIDETPLGQLTEDHSIVITLEDGILDGGFGEKIAGFYGPSKMKVYNYGLKKEFLDRYEVEDVLKANHLTTEQIYSDISDSFMPRP